jgi:uncharacterized protein YegP (UPF0339 family)
MIEFYKDNGNKYRWRVRGENGEIIGASSQGFASKQMAQNNVALLATAIVYVGK